MFAEIDEQRVRPQNYRKPGPGPVLYWMNRDQRINDNWALLFAQQLALESGAPLGIVFCLRRDLRRHSGTARMLDFMLAGLREVERNAAARDIGFLFIIGQPDKEIPALAQRLDAGAIVTDFSPLRTARRWRRAIAKYTSAAFYEVDTHNIVPCWVASDRREFAARTIRPKITRQLPRFLTEFPEVTRHPVKWTTSVQPTDWQSVRDTVKVDQRVRPVDWTRPGETEGTRALARFSEERLASYEAFRNDPNEDGQSGLSPYLHFGQLSAQRVALQVNRAVKNAVKRSVKQDSASPEAARVFLEELIIRRELSDNFCFYNSEYDSFDAFPRWAQVTLARHARDNRPITYSAGQLESASTHDPLWNAAQNEMARTGKMHGYMRMYWAKKALEWSISADEALRVLIYLNDKYELDGRDPNGYAGIAWSVGGVHDRPWFDRPIFGAVRYMSARGAASKFDVTEYISKNQ